MGKSRRRFCNKKYDELFQRYNEEFKQEIKDNLDDLDWKLKTKRDYRRTEFRLEVPYSEDIFVITLYPNERKGRRIELDKRFIKAHVVMWHEYVNKTRLKKQGRYYDCEFLYNRKEQILYKNIGENGLDFRDYAGYEPMFIGNVEPLTKSHDNMQVNKLRRNLTNTKAFETKR